MSNLGHELARSTIAAILERLGIEPAPERRRKTTWQEFLSWHWEMIVATDFFTVEVWTRRGLQLNAYAERFVRSIKQSCLERMILFGEESLRTAIQNFVAHYHSERNHQGLANQLISPDAGHLGSAGEVQSRQRLGGMLNYYYRALLEPSSPRPMPR